MPYKKHAIPLFGQRALWLLGGTWRTRLVGTTVRGRWELTVLFGRVSVWRRLSNGLELFSNQAEEGLRVFEAGFLEHDRFSERNTIIWVQCGPQEYLVANNHFQYLHNLCFLCQWDRVSSTTRVVQAVLCQDIQLVSADSDVLQRPWHS